VTLLPSRAERDRAMAERCGVPDEDVDAFVERLRLADLRRARVERRAELTDLRAIARERLVTIRAIGSFDDYIAWKLGLSA
jgi:hypothetical protein